MRPGRAPWVSEEFWYIFNMLYKHSIDTIVSNHILFLTMYVLVLSNSKSQRYIRNLEPWRNYNGSSSRCWGCFYNDVSESRPTSTHSSSPSSVFGSLLTNSKSSCLCWQGSALLIPCIICVECNDNPINHEVMLVIFINIG